MLVAGPQAVTSGICSNCSNKETVFCESSDLHASLLRPKLVSAKVGQALILGFLQVLEGNHKWSGHRRKLKRYGMLANAQSAQEFRRER